jgi:hypothetical protein
LVCGKSGGVFPRTPGARLTVCASSGLDQHASQLPPVISGRDPSAWCEGLFKMKISVLLHRPAMGMGGWPCLFYETLCRIYLMGAHIRASVLKFKTADILRGEYAYCAAPSENNQTLFLRWQCS